MRCVAAVLLVALSCAGAAASPTVYVSPPSVEVTEGATFTMGIRVDAGVDTLTCFLVDFAFDADVVELVSAEEGTLFSDCGYETMFAWDIQGAGQHSCNDVTLGHWAYTMCPGELVHLTFEANSWGTTALQIVAVDLRDINREPILPVGTEDATITVIPATGIDGTLGGGEGRVAAAPNPFRGSVTLTVGAESSGEPTELLIYDVAGRLVRSWSADELANPGGTVTWDGTAGDGTPCRSGVYFALARYHGVERRGRIVLFR